MTTFTEHLRSRNLHLYINATQHPFLTSAGQHTLPPSLLSLWLSQDRIYAAHAYPRFVGSLISKIPFSSHHAINSSEEQKNQKLLEVLSFALNNVVREASFFLDVSRDWGLEISAWKERKATRDYVAEMARVGGLCSVEEGLVFLWAMEQTYLDAWDHVKKVLQRSHSNEGQEESPTSQAIRSFVANWTSPEFVAFVDDLAFIVNNLERLEHDEELKLRAEMIWDRVIELEIAFWPDQSELDSGKIEIPGSMSLM